jgi:hypothetical protein
MSAAQILSGANASVSPLVTPAPGTNVLVSCRNGAAASGGLAVRADVQGSVMNIAEQATLATTIGGVGSAGDLFEYRTTVCGAPAAGGVLPGRKQWFTYKNGAFDAEILRTGVPGQADEGLIYANVTPIGIGRVGYTPALVLGANAIACPTVTASSTVLLSVAGPAAALAAGAAVPVVVNAAGVGFTVTAIAAQVGTVYSYQVIG